MLLVTGATAQVTSNDWYVYATAGAEARTNTGTGTSGGSNAECNGPSQTCSASAGFVGGHSATGTTASVSAAGSGYYVDRPSDASAFASADLSTGELKITTLSDGFPTENTSAAAQASFRDLLHFDLGNSTTPVAITVDLRVDGSFEGYVQPRFAFSLTNGVTALSTGIVGWSDANPDGPSTTADAAFIDFDGHTGRSGDWTTYGPDNFVGTFLIDPLHPDVYVTMDLTAGGSTEYGDTFTALGHTAAVSFQLPDNVRFTSDSGTFLSDAPGSTVLEPATWMMLLMGFGGLGAVLRHRRQPQAQ